MNRKNRKKRKRTPLKNGLKELLIGCLRLTIVITIFLGGNDYHVNTVIQLNAAPCALAAKTLATTLGGRYAYPG
jgi:hypothetical protein